ncbi:hypothetical protein ACLB1O_04090 [Escherichia coli]
MRSCWIPMVCWRNLLNLIMVREAYFQRHDFIANGGELKPQENPNAQAIQDDLKDIPARKQ